VDAGYNASRPGYAVHLSMRGVTASHGLRFGPFSLTCGAVHNRLFIMENPIVWLFDEIIFLYMVIIFAMIIMSWLIGFNVVNGSNYYVRQVSYALHRLTEPLLGPIRRLMPDLGGIDISPIFLVLGIIFFQKAVHAWVFPLL
jgi:YggT family protein